MTATALVSAGRWLGSALIVAACVEAAGMVAQRGRGDRRRVSRLLRSYDDSRAGRRLRRQLANACVDMSPSRWRMAQGSVAAPLAAGLHAVAGLSVLGALGLGITLTRVGGWLALRARRDRRWEALARAAPPLGWALATELASGRGAAAALVAVARGQLVDAHPALRPLLADAAHRVTLGADSRSALEMALQAASRGQRSPSDALGMVVAAYTIHAHLGGDHAPLTVLADALEETRRTREQARASTGEPRVVAIAVLGIGLVAAVPVIAANPATLRGAVGIPELPILAVCVAVGLSGLAIVLRMTRV